MLAKRDIQKQRIYHLICDLFSALSVNLLWLDIYAYKSFFVTAKITFVFINGWTVESATFAVWQTLNGRIP